MALGARRVQRSTRSTVLISRVRIMNLAGCTVGLMRPESRRNGTKRDERGKGRFGKRFGIICFLLLNLNMRSDGS